MSGKSLPLRGSGIMEKGPDVALLDARNALYFELGDVSIWRKSSKSTLKI